MSNFAIFIIGFIILIAGLAYGANMAGMSPKWIAVLVGIGVVMGVTKTRSKEQPH